MIRSEKPTSTSTLRMSNLTRIVYSTVQYTTYLGNLSRKAFSPSARLNLVNSPGMIL